MNGNIIFYRKAYYKGARQVQILKLKRDECLNSEDFHPLCGFQAGSEL